MSCNVAKLEKLPNSIYILRDYCRNIYSNSSTLYGKKYLCTKSSQLMTLSFTNTSKQSHFLSQKFLRLWANKFANFACWMEPPCGRTPYFEGKSMKIYLSKTWKTRWMKTYSTASTCIIHQHLISDKVNFTSTRSLVGAQLLTNHPWKLCIHIHRHIALVYHP